MSDDLGQLGQLGKAAGGALAVIAGLFYGVNKLKLTANADSSTAGLIKTLREERDEALERAKTAETERDEARRSMAEMIGKLESLEITVSDLNHRLEERNDHLELVILVLDHLMMHRPLPEELRARFAMFHLLGKDYKAPDAA